VTDEVRQTPSVCFRCDMGIPRRPTGTSNTDALVWEYEHYWGGQEYTMPCYRSRRYLQEEG